MTVLENVLVGMHCRTRAGLAGIMLDTADKQGGGNSSWNSDISTIPEDPAAIHWSESFPKTIPEIDARKKTSPPTFAI